MPESSQILPVHSPHSSGKKKRRRKAACADSAKPGIYLAGTTTTVSPVLPSAPVSPLAPSVPGMPDAPVAPVGPGTATVEPVAPVAPVGPAGPGTTTTGAAAGGATVVFSQATRPSVPINAASSNEYFMETFLCEINPHVKMKLCVAFLSCHDTQKPLTSCSANLQR